MSTFFNGMSKFIVLACLNAGVVSCGNQNVPKQSHSESIVVKNDGFWNRVFHNSSQDYLLTVQIRRNNLLSQCWYQHSEPYKSGDETHYSTVKEVLEQKNIKTLTPFFLSASLIGEQLDSQKYWNSAGSTLKIALRRGMGAFACNSIALTAFGAAIGPFSGVTAAVVGSSLCGIAGIWEAFDTGPVDGGAVAAAQEITNEAVLTNPEFQLLDRNASKELVKAIRKVAANDVSSTKACPLPHELTLESVTTVQNK